MRRVRLFVYCVCCVFSKSVSPMTGFGICVKFHYEKVKVKAQGQNRRTDIIPLDCGLRYLHQTLAIRQK